MPGDPELGGRIREARHAKGLLLRDVAEILGVGENFVGSMERGVEKIPPARLLQLQEILEIQLTEDAPASKPTEVEIELAYWMNQRLDETGFLPKLGSPVPQTTQEGKPW